VEKRKQEKLEALNQLKEKLAEKRKNINVQTAGAAGATGEKPAGGNVNEEALQHLMASLEEKRQKRREERQKKKVQRRASRAASIRIISGNLPPCPPHLLLFFFLPLKIPFLC